MQLLREAPVRPVQPQVEAVLQRLIEQFAVGRTEAASRAPGARFRLKEMDITDLIADVSFYDKMMERGGVQAGGGAGAAGADGVRIRKLEF